MQIDAEVLGWSNIPRNVPRVSGVLTRLASAPKSRFWMTCLDLYPALAAFALPWSTTAVSVVLVVWLISLVPTISPRALLASLKRPESFLPIAFFALAVLGTLWSDDPWAVRIQGLHPVFKLLAIPFLLYHFSRSERSSWVLIAFFASCALLMGCSWLLYLEPSLSSGSLDTIGIPARNYVDQSQEFSLCLFAAAPVLLTLIAENRRVPAWCCGVLLLGFYGNMMFVVIARTVFLYLPVLTALFAVSYCRPKAARFLIAAAVVQAAVWYASPNLRNRLGRSRRAHWVFIAFLASCTLLMGFSWLIHVAPGLTFVVTGNAGVPVKNYVDQSQEFALCLFAAAPLLLISLEAKRFGAALGWAVLSLGFLCNMLFVVIARTAFIYMPVLLVLFAVWYFRPKAAAGLVMAGMAIMVLLGVASPYVRHRVQWIAHDYDLRARSDVATSDGERMAYWRASIRSIEQAPVIGHGTGSTKQLFDVEAAGKTGEWANAIRNPHNQTLYVAIQWGLLGCMVLYATWYFHLALFLGRSFAAWVGLVVVVQNFVSSLVNSHLFDFHEGWIYVLGVGVAGGRVAAARRGGIRDASAKPAPVPAAREPA